MMSWDRDLPAIDAAAAAARGWDVAVIGAGPAGTIAAFHLARSGARVLLVEKQRFPRPKVCGCCLNAAALELLSGCGLADLPYRAAAQRLSALELSARGRTALLRLPTGAALSRERLDALLASEAIRAGATFLPGTSAAVGAIESNGRGVSMSNAGQEFRTTPRIIVVADGLSGRALRHCPDFKSFTAAHSRVGGNTTLPGPVSGYDAGVIYMACGRGGYVGAVVLEDDRLDVAAAMDVAFIQRHGGLGQSARNIIADAGLPAVPGLEDARWHGTPRLTARRTPLAQERVFLIGDAAGYVEPLTGEGMAWALASGTAVAPLAWAGASRWNASLARRWGARYRQILSTRQRRCRMITRLVRHPALAWVIVTALAHFPGLARPTLVGINRPLLHCG
jgi:flavin-dependent dehydrogenase